MNFNDWWNGQSGFGNFTIKELKEMNGGPSNYKDYVEDLEEAFYAGKPKPSTDFSIPKSNPFQDYLLFDKEERQWFVGWYSDECDIFFWTTPALCEDERLNPSHWLPMPDTPDT